MLKMLLIIRYKSILAEQSDLCYHAIDLFKFSYYSNFYYTCNLKKNSVFKNNAAMTLHSFKKDQTCCFEMEALVHIMLGDRWLLLVLPS